MIEEARRAHRTPTRQSTKISYSRIVQQDIDATARIFIHSFPQRVNKWFQNKSHSVDFIRDMLELMRLAHGRTFFAARHNDRLIGFLILTLPNKRLLLALLRERFFLRAAALALTGRYGLSFSVLSRAVKELFVMRGPGRIRAPSNRPNVYAVAVEKQYRGRGIGSALIEQARLACRDSFSQMWLFVDVENVTAIRLYERMGFLIVNSDHSQHLMTWDFDTSGTGSKAE